MQELGKLELVLAQATGPVTIGEPQVLPDVPVEKVLDPDELEPVDLLPHLPFDGLEDLELPGRSPPP